MRIQPDALIAGFPANRITELLRQSDEFLPCHDATKILGLDGDKARHLLERLHQEGFIHRNTDVPASAGRTDKLPNGRRAQIRA